MERMATTIELDVTPEEHVAATAPSVGAQLQRMSVFVWPACRKAGVVFRVRGGAAARQVLGPGHRRPNKSFKPKPLRYAKHMAGKACHVFSSTTRLGLTLALGALLRYTKGEDDGNDSLC